MAEQIFDTADILNKEALNQVPSEPVPEPAREKPPRRTQEEWAAAWPGLRKKGAELVGACPVCEDADQDDRFHVNADGLFGCRKCDDGPNPDWGAEALKKVFPISGAAPVSKKRGAAQRPKKRLWVSLDAPKAKGGYYTSTNHEHYIYRTADGAMVGEVYRARPEHGAAAGKAAKRYWDGKEWVFKQGELAKYLWRLPNIIEAAKNGLPVHIAEGERKTRDLVKIGKQLGATCHINGAKGFGLAHAKQVPIGGKVVIWLDNDEPGRAWASAWAAGLVNRGHDASNIIMVLPEDMGFDHASGDHKDVGDWIQGKGQKEVEALVNACNSWSKVQALPGFDPTATSKTAKAAVKKARQEQAAEDNDAALIAKAVSGALNPMDHRYLAWTAIRLYQGELAITPNLDPLSDHSSEQGRVYILQPDGVWSCAGYAWSEVMSKVADEITAEVAGSASSYEDVAALDRAFIKARNLANHSTARAVQKLVYSEYRKLEKANDPLAAGVRLVREDQWDTDTESLGVQNGVVDLANAQLLSPADAALRCVTHRSPHAFDPKANHKYVNELLSHVHPAIAAFLLGQVAWSVRFGPGRRFILITGPANSGKSTLLRAIMNALGPKYCVTLSSRALDKPRFAKSGDEASPSLMKFLPPARAACLSDASGAQKDADLIKQLTGYDKVTGRFLSANETSFVPQALPIIACNRDAVPGFGLASEALQSRFVHVEMTEVPKNKRDLSRITEIGNDQKVGAAMLARLVLMAAMMNKKQSIVLPQAVIDSTKALVKSDQGLFGELAARLVPDAKANVLVEEIWNEWCRMHDENPDSRYVGGKTRIMLIKDLKDFNEQLPDKQVGIRKPGFDTQKRGWWGWRLLPEQVMDDPGYVQDQADMAKFKNALVTEGLVKPDEPDQPAPQEPSQEYVPEEDSETERDL